VCFGYSQFGGDGLASGNTLVAPLPFRFSSDWFHNTCSVSVLFPISRWLLLLLLLLLFLLSFMLFSLQSLVMQARMR
jgi:hypothetical protein